MGRKAFAPEQIINKLREAEVHLSQGDSVGQGDYLSIRLVLSFFTVVTDKESTKSFNLKAINMIYHDDALINNQMLYFLDFSSKKYMIP